jgi:amino acid adenylation domain-containing protein
MMYRNNLKVEYSVGASQNIKEKKFWLNKLSQVPEKSSFPSGFRRKKGDERRMEPVKFRLSSETFSKLMKLSNQSDYTLNSILVTQLVLLLNRYTGSTDIVVGTPIYKQETEADLINTKLVLRNQFEEDIAFKQLLLQVTQGIFEATEHYSYPLEMLVDQLEESTPREGEFPLFDIAIMLENIHEPEYIRDVNINMLFSFLRTAEGIEGVLEYNSLLYEKPVVDKIITHYQRLFEKTLTNVEIKLKHIDILTTAEKKQLLQDFNRTAAAYPKEKTIHGTFEEQVEKEPHRTAVVFEQRHLTYKELNKRANGTARVLREKGVQSDSIVGIMLEPSMYVPVGILGILKAGGAYLPIDTDHPESRIIYMLEDCGVDLILTSSRDIKSFSITALQRLSDAGKKLHLTGPRKQLKELDGLPFADRSLVDYEKYNQYIGLAAVKDSIVLQGTRGCPYKCAYCHKIWPKTHIVRSAENIFAEIRRLYDIGIRRFALIDDIFNLNVKNSTRFFELIIENGLELQLFFPNGLRGELLTGDYIDLMVKAGTINISLSLETASPRLQKMIKKNLNIEKLRENIRYICEKHPQVISDVQTMHGFPGETEEEALKTLDFIMQMKWVHFPYVHIVKIYPNTDMETIALANGVPQEVITRSTTQGYHELSDTLPFDKRFSLWYQSEFLNSYFLSKERLLHVLPYQMKILTEDEIVQKYNAYLATDIKCLEDVLNAAGIEKEELAISSCRAKDYMFVPDLNARLKKLFPEKQPDKNALRLLILDLTTFFSDEHDVFYDMIEPPLGPMAVFTYLNQKFGSKINGKIAKSRLDFDNYAGLKDLLDEFKPEVIGIRALTYYKEFFHKTAAMIRGWGIRVPVIAGGPYATSDYATILQDPNVDLVVLGEGEVTFSELVGKIIENGGRLPKEATLEEIPGIAYVPGPGNPGETSAREIIMLDALDEVLSQQAGENLGTVNTPSDLAYSIFTSGSTGKPKGTLTTHGNVVKLVKNTNYIELEETHRLLQLSNYAFDGSIFDIYGALLNGGALVMMKREYVFDLEKLAGIIQQENITAFFVTTALFNALVDFKVEYLKNIKYVLFGGEGVSVEHTKKALEYLGKGTVIHVYGPTETTVFATYYEVNEFNERIGTFPIGAPLANTTLFILGRNLELVPLGVTGEIYIGGHGLARGYLNNPELTNSKFRIPNEREPFRQPFQSWSHASGPYNSHSPHSPHSPLYSTGDLGRWLPDGNVEFIGRVDHQVKIRGFRVEVGEVEAHLLKHENIKEAVVLIKQGGEGGAASDAGGGDRYLCAYIVVNPPLEVSELRKYLARELPDYMIPAYFVTLDKLPLNPNGKVDKKQLPDPIETLEMKKGYTAPQNEIEKKLVRIWSEVLEIQEQKIGITDDFYQLGGDSMKAIKVISKAKQENIHFSIKDMLYYKDIREIAQNARYEKQEMSQVEVSGTAPLLPIQEWFFELDHPHPAFYNLAHLIPLNQNADPGILEKSLKKLIQHHDALRMNFIKENGKWVQVNRKIDETNFSLEYITLDEPGVEKQHTKKHDEIQKIQNSMNLEKGLLIKAAIFDPGKAGRELFIAIHHLIADIVSLNVFYEDLTELYSRYSRDMEIELKPKTTSYLEWSNRLHTQIKPGDIDTGYWKNLELDRIDHLVNEKIKIKDLAVSNSIITSSPLDKKTTRDLRFAGIWKYDATLEEMFLAALVISLHEIANLNDILIGLESHGRAELFEDVDLSRTIGWFTNSAPVVIPHKGDIKSTLESTKNILRGLPHKGIHYSIARYILNEDVPPLDCQIGFNFQGESPSFGEAGSLFKLSSGGEFPLPVHPGNFFPFILQLSPLIYDNRIQSIFIFNKKYINPKIKKKLPKIYNNVLKRMIDESK